MSDSESDFEMEVIPKKKPLKEKVTLDDHFGGSKVKKPAAKPKPVAKPKKKNDDEENGDDPYNVFEDINTATQGGKKRLSIERIYQKKSQLEHVLLRPDTYIGSTEPDKQTMWVYDQENDEMVNREINLVPGLYKIFDEILVNAADNKQRDKNMNCIKITIDSDKNEISVWNNGKGIPVAHHATENMWVPELIFGTLLTSSNYDDTQKKVTGGRNGFGAKLCNIFSTKFVVETSCKEYKKKFRQTWVNNMTKSGDAEIMPSDGDDFTKITFRPDLAKFKMEALDNDVISLMKRRAYDVAGANKGVKVFLNGKKLPVVGFKQYVEQYVKNRNDENGEPLKVVHEEAGKRWEVAVTVSDKGFQQVSFVNSIATTKGGKHVDHVAEQIVSKVIENVKKKMGKGGLNIKPFQIKNHMWLFVNCMIENPSFDSQTKETLTLQVKNFGSKCELSDKFVNQALKCGIVESVMSWVKFKQSTQLQGTCSNRKTNKLKGVAKLEDANDAGTNKSSDCTLILTEGDSAKSLAVAGLGVVGRDKYGVFPLKGKVLNVREATHKQIMENAEVNSLIKILGLQYRKKYDTSEDMKSLRYGKVMIMADQDQDGSHIKGLVINFIHYNWPSLMKKNFVEQFITPIVKATKGANANAISISFYSMPEYLEWKKDTPNWNTFKIKYYKGLGTSTSKEAKEYFSDMARHRILFSYAGESDDKAIELAFSKKEVEGRKEWLTGWMKERRERRELALPDEFLYDKNTKTVSFNEFVKKELVLFSNMDNERSIPSLVDGFKPGQRKVLFTCFKRNDRKEVKVAQLAGSVAEMSAYHHGEVSLHGTIVNLAQDYVGSNNINLLLPSGQFGSRNQGGKDAASPRYIFTMLNPVTRTLFPQADDEVLRYLSDDNQRIEPEYYIPIIPMVLVNGAEGIGTGWSTKVPCFNPRELAKNMKTLISSLGEDCKTIKPFYKNFNGEIQSIEGDHSRFVCHGEIQVLDESTIEITELPVGKWTQVYKESVLDPMLGTDKIPAIIQDYKEYHTHCTVRFTVKIDPKKLDQMERADSFHSVFKLSNTINLTSMVLFDADGVLRKFERPEEIMREFYEVRRKTYIARKKYLEGVLKAQADRLTAQARFILEKIEGKIEMENKKKKAIIEQLIKRGYEPDPVKTWKEKERLRKLAELGDDGEEEETQANDEGETVTAVVEDARMGDYEYLVHMQLIKVSEEEKDKLLKQRDEKTHELQTILGKTWSDLWLEDLDVFMEALDKQQAKEREDDLAQISKSKGDAPKGRGKKQLKLKQEVMPSPHGRRIAPRIDASLKLKLEKAVEAKEKKGSKLKKVKEEDNLEDSSLFERLVKNSPDFAAKNKKPATVKIVSTNSKATKKLDVDEDEQKEKKGATKRKAVVKSPGKGKKKKNEWETDSEASETEDEQEKYDGFSDKSDEADYVPINKAPAKARVTIDSDSNDDAESVKQEPASPDVIDVIPDSRSPSPVPAPKKAPAKPKAAAKPKPAPKSKVVKKSAGSESDEDAPSKKSQKLDSDEDDSPPPTKRERPGRAKKAMTYKIDDDESEEGGDEPASEDSYKSD